MVSTIVWPSRFSRAMNCHRPWRSSTSTPAVGSSSTITGGLCTSACADQHAPLHAARERAHVGVGLGGEIEVVHHLVDPGVVVADAEVARLDAQRLAHGEKRIEHELLRHHAERAARRAIVGDHVVAHHARAAASARVEAGDDRDQRGLAGAVGPEQAEELALLDREVTPASACTAPKRFSRFVTSIAFSGTLRE